MMTYPKRLIEVDLPIKKISAHARREKSILHGHISTLHIWWARRPLAACRAVTWAALWIDPVDPLCPDGFRERAAELMMAFARKAATDQELAKSCSTGIWEKWQILAKPENVLDMAKPEHRNILRNSLLDFIADFANWDNSTQSDYLATSRALTQAAHEALGGMPGTRPLVVDPFAGGGAIPLEALRVGADAFASDLNPVAVLLNKVVLEYIPKYGQQLADEVRKWGQWIKEEAEKELSEFYPKDEDGSTPIAYLWARTIISEAPDDGSGIPVEVPLMRSLWLAKKKGRNRALRWLRDGSGLVKTETVEITYADGVTRTVRRPLLEIFEPKNENEVESGTIKRGSATCPVTCYTTPANNVRKQFQNRQGGANDARLIAIVSLHSSNQGRIYRLSDVNNINAFINSNKKLFKKIEQHAGKISLIPNEKFPYLRSIFNAQLLDINQWGELFNSRQSLVISHFANLINKIKLYLPIEYDPEFSKAIQTCLALALNKQADLNNSLCRWKVDAECPVNLFGRQVIPIVWDFAEPCVLSNSSGSWSSMYERTAYSIEKCHYKLKSNAYIEQVSAIENPLPDQSVQFFCSDPPYYDAVPYADLSDFFYVWLRRTIKNIEPLLFNEPLTMKNGEIVQLAERNKEYSYKTHSYFENLMTQAMLEGKRILQSESIGVIIFAHKSTAGWEAQLQAMIDAEWIITASWAIDTEMGARLRAQKSAALASSIHLVCRPRTTNEIGDWREILQELPPRIHQWMPRLAREGVVGADAIFACLGPALEIYSRYASVERANGETVTLREYLEYVWATVSKEALGMIFNNATATDLEEDARLTAMWLWTLTTDGSETSESSEDLEEEEDDDETPSKNSKTTGFTLEYDAARKIAQGLGAYLEKLGSLVEIKGSNARLLPVAERAAYLFGKEGLQEPKPQTKKAKSQQLALDFGDVINQLTEEQGTPEITVTHIGKTILDRIHQTMLLFAAGRSEALARFLVEDGIGTDQRFWTLAQSLSALYPPGTDEKRWIDGILARKKGLGF